MQSLQLDLIADLISLAGGVIEHLPDPYKRDLQYVAQGAGRTVYKYHEFVLKYPSNNSGMEQSEVERMLFFEDTTDRLCPVAFHKGGVLAQLFTKVIEDKNPWRSIIDWMKENNYSVEEISEIILCLNLWEYKYNMYRDDLEKVSSWGLLDGRLVCIDFGCTLEIHKKYYASVRDNTIPVLDIN